MVAFFDTNVLLYALETGDKAARARTVIDEGGSVSVQVMNELVNALAGKYRRPWDQIEASRDDLLELVGLPRALTMATHLLAGTLVRDHRLHIYDALIVASAIEAGCDTLYSEDMHAGWRHAGLTVVNPFGRGSGR